VDLAVAVAVAAALVVLVLAVGAVLADNDILRVVIRDTFDAEKAGPGPAAAAVVAGRMLDFANTGMQDARRFLVLPATQLVLVAEAATLEEVASSQFIMAHSSISSTTGVGI
jgi:hypothetical protein